MWKSQGRSQIMDFDEVLPVIREGVGSGSAVNYVDGKPVKREPLTFKAYGNIQPLSREDLKMVPEGDRLQLQYTFYGNRLEMPLKTEDKVLRQGVVFQVQDTDDWGSSNFVKARIMKVDVGPDVTDLFDLDGTDSAPGAVTDDAQ